MKHSRSADEQEIRDEVVGFCHKTLPGYRIIHELNTNGQGSRRADVAAVGTHEIVIFEIKSKKDTLTRLREQWDAFDACAHHTHVVAHRKWFSEREPRPGRLVLDPHEKLKFLRIGKLWIYPQPEERYGQYRWELDRYGRGFQPRASCLLSLLWRDELAEECARHSIVAGRRATITSMIQEMCWLLKGREIAELVCRQLRARPFAEADEPIVDERFRSHLHRPAPAMQERAGSLL